MKAIASIRCRENQYQASFGATPVVDCNGMDNKAGRCNILLVTFRITGRNRGAIAQAHSFLLGALDELTYNTLRTLHQHAIGPGVLQKLIEHILTRRPAMNFIFRPINRGRVKQISTTASHTQTKAT
jgi:hypothetical protein